MSLSALLKNGVSKIDKKGRNRQESQERQMQPPISASLLLGPLYTIVVFRTLVQLSFLTYIPIFLKQMNLSPIRIGTAITAFAAAGAVGGMIAGSLFDRIGGRKLFLISAMISPVFLLLTAQTRSPEWLILWFSLAGLFLMMTIPISVLMGQTIVPGAISTVSKRTLQNDGSYSIMEA